MRLIGEADKRVDDLRIDSDGLELVIDPNSASNLNGASVDFEDRVVRSGFKFNNPNKPEVPEVGSGPRGDLTGSTAERVQQLLDRELNPAVAAHGGRINFVGVKDNKVYLSFGGGCHGCGMVDVTLKQGVEARIRELIPEIEEVVDTTDHSSGQNPFYA
ncbi:MAG: NifU family protein [Acidobacteriota bacterium]